MMSEMSKPATESAGTAPEAPARSGARRWSLVLILLLLVLPWVLVVYVHTNDARLQDRFAWFDRALATFMTVGVVMLTASLLFGWFVFLSGLSRTVRVGFGVVSVLVVVGTLASLRPYGNDGDIRGWKFRFFWQSLPDQKLPMPTVASSAVDFSNISSDVSRGGTGATQSFFGHQDFPQFLGPNRNGAIQGILLAKDWDAEPPRELWTQPIGAGWSAFSAANGFAVTMEQRGEQELVTCYNVETGEIVWFHAEEGRHEDILGGIGPRSTPTIHQGKVYTVGALGVLLCLDGATGEVIWRKDLLEEFNTSPEQEKAIVSWGRANSPLIYQDKLIVPAGGPQDDRGVSLVAYHVDTGEEIWRGGEQQISYSSPIVVQFSDGPQIVIQNEATVAGHDPETGEELWSYDRPGQSNAAANTSQPVSLPGQRLLLTKGYGTGAAVIQLNKTADGFGARTAWSNSRHLKTKFTSAVVRDGYAYGLSDGILECVRVSSGERAWKNGRYGHGQVLMVFDRLLVLSEKGYVALVAANPEKFIQLTKFTPLEGVTWNTICLYGNKLLVRNSELAACYELPVINNRDEQESGEDGTSQTPAGDPDANETPSGD